MRPSADPRRLFVVIGSLHVGGTEQHLARLLPELVRRGWQVTLFPIAGDGPLRPALERGGVSVRVTRHVDWLLVGRLLPLRLVRLALVAVHLVVLMRSTRPAVAHLFLPEAYVMGAVCAMVAGVPHLVMSRRSLNRYQRIRPLVARVERWLHPRMSLIAGNSRAVLRELEAEGVPPSRLRLTYNGIRLPAPADAGGRARSRAALALAPDALVIISVANLIPYKGHLDLLEALAPIAGTLPGDWRLVCAGRDLGHGAALLRRARELGLGGRALWLGARDDVAELLAAADLGVLASHEEGFSNAVLEGMGAGLPMVVTDVGGNAEAVLDGETGIVVPARDPAGLGRAILRLAADPALRLRLGRAGRARVAAHFSLEACVDQYEELYREVGVSSLRPLPGGAATASGRARAGHDAMPADPEVR